MVIYNKELSKKHKAVKDRIRVKNKDSIYIPYPTEHSETEVVHYILNELHELEIDARAEVSSKDGTSRFDIVIFKNKVAQRIIEVKKRNGTLTETQRKKYEKYQIPVDHVRGVKGADKYLKTAFEVILSQPIELEKRPSRRKITEEFQPCRKCETPVIRIFPQRTEKPGQKYRFQSYLKCPSCETMYMNEKDKIYL